MLRGYQAAADQTVIDVIWNLFVESGVKAQIHGFEKTNGHL